LDIVITRSSLSVPQLTANPSGGLFDPSQISSVLRNDNRFNVPLQTSVQADAFFDELCRGIIAGERRPAVHVLIRQAVRVVRPVSFCSAATNVMPEIDSMVLYRMSTLYAVDTSS
jgi:hypothetical protein